MAPCLDRHGGGVKLSLLAEESADSPLRPWPGIFRPKIAVFWAIFMIFIEILDIHRYDR
jgi:hypothetical protein